MASQGVSQEISQVTQSSAQMAGSSSQVKEKANGLSRLAGTLSIHDWTDTFGLEFAGGDRFSTIAGLVTSLFGRIPRQHDSVYFKNLKFTVERMCKHRIESVILSIAESKA